MPTSKEVEEDARNATDWVLYNRLQYFDIKTKNGKISTMCCTCDGFFYPYRGPRVSKSDVVEYRKSLYTPLHVRD